MALYCDICGIKVGVLPLNIKINYKALATEPYIFKGDVCTKCGRKIFKAIRGMRDEINSAIGDIKKL